MLKINKTSIRKMTLMAYSERTYVGMGPGPDQNGSLCIMLNLHAATYVRN